MMTSFNFGHSKLFWEEILFAIGIFEELNEHERSISLVSPWIRDLSLSSSNMSSDEWGEALGMPNKVFSNLSDVLIALSIYGFKITILTLDSEDKALPKQDRNHLAKEERFVKKLTSSSNSAHIKVMKKFGIHNKLYCFPGAVLVGSVNMTHRGMLGNSESLELISREKNQSEYLDNILNLNSLLSGSVDYGLGTLVRIDDEEFERIYDEINQIELNQAREDQGRIFSMGVEIPSNDEDDDRFLTNAERDRMNADTKAFENELRSFVLAYYRSYGHEIKSWEDSGVKPQKHWHKLLYMDAKKTLHDKAADVLRKKKLRPKDLGGAKLPDLKNLNADTTVFKGTTLGDLRTALLGRITDEILPLEDYANNDLADRGIIRLTGDIRKVKSDRQQSQFFWSKYFGATDTAFDYVYWVRNELAHHGEISLERANEALYGMETIRRAIFKPFFEKHRGDNVP